MKLITLESQPDFPQEDISDSSAELLELLLQNRTLIDTTHASAETLFLYRLGHGTLDRTAAPHLDDRQRTMAFSLGITAFEAISTLVRPIRNPEDPDEGLATLHVMQTAQLLNQDFVPTLVDAGDKFRTELPRTHHIIGTTAARFCHGFEDYSQRGAAIAREIELQTTRG